MRQQDQKQTSQKPPKRVVYFLRASAVNLTLVSWTKILELQRWPLAKRSHTSDVEAPAPQPQNIARVVFITLARSPAARTRPSTRPQSHSTHQQQRERRRKAKHGAPEQQRAPRRRRRRRGAARRGRVRRGAAVVRAHRVPGVRGGGQRQRVRDPAVHGRHVGLHLPHRGHLLRRRHAHRLPPAVQLHPGEERVQRDDRDDGAGADGGGAQRRALLRLLIRRQLLRAGQEPGGPAAGRGPARAALGRGPVRRRAPVRGLRGGRGRRRAGRAARRQPAGDQVGRRGQRGPRAGPGDGVHRGPVQLAVRVQRQGQRDLDALRRRQGGL